MNDEDTYGSTIRNRMKAILGQPSGEWKPLNQRRRLSDSLGYKIGSNVMLVIICVGVWFLLNYLESFGRIK